VETSRPKIEWQKLLDEALTAPGNLGNVYSRFHDYSIGNMMLFMMQGIHEPVASASRWKQLGREVTNWKDRKEVLVPQFAKEPPPPPPEDESIEEKRERVARLIGFKVVRAIFPLSATDGPEIPPIQVPEWDLETALDKLAIRRVPFEQIDGNIQGVSHGREYALNPVAVHPLKTTFHELAHIVLGHTVATNYGEYSQHKGKMEFGAEAVAYLAMNELEQMDEETAAHSRGYIQHYLAGEQPSEREIRLVFAAADQILRAGRLASDEQQG
jgi:hypothetical protein